MCGSTSQDHSETGPKQRRLRSMTGHLNKLLSSVALLKLAAIALFALLMLLASGDIDPTAGRSQSVGNNTCVAKNVSCFNPVNTSTYCQEGTGGIDKNQLTVSCQPDISPGSHPDVVSAFNIGL